MKYYYKVAGQNMKHHVYRKAPKGFEDVLVARCTEEREAKLVVAALNAYKP